MRAGGEEPKFTITPRKGQFVVFKVPEKKLLVERIIGPVATQYTKGVICWTTVHGNIVVGPTAVDQSSRDDRSTDETTVQQLIAYGKSVIPELVDAEVVGTYSGLRPASEHRDYVIGFQRRRNAVDFRWRYPFDWSYCLKRYWRVCC